MKLHVLPGDAQVGTFNEIGLPGDVAVCREVLMEGPVGAPNPEEFWNLRAGYVSTSYGVSSDSYFGKVAAEFEKLTGLEPGSEVNLWFEYEMFCQVNMWFCLYSLRSSDVTVYRVAPVVRNEDDRWKGFGGLKPEEMHECYAKRNKLTPDDILLGADLWEAYQNGDNEKIGKLTATDRFPYLNEVGKAAIEQETRPKLILKEIVEYGLTDFKDIFQAFSERAGVYGYSDLQVKAVLNEL